MPRRIAGWTAVAALQLVALVLAHELVFLARYGSRYGEALAHAGHGETWSNAVATAAAFAVILATVATARLLHLGVLVRRASPRGDHRPLDLRSLLAAWLRVGPAAAVSTATILSIQENLERATTGLPVPGPAILLTPEYAGGLWIALAVGLLVGLVAALFRWRRDALLARLRAVRAGLPRVANAAGARPGIPVAPPRESRLGRGSALRAPPLGSAT